jgi:hypothetical protein
MFRQRFLAVPVTSGDAVSGMHAEAAAIMIRSKVASANILVSAFGGLPR